METRARQDPDTGMLPPISPRAMTPRGTRPAWVDNRCGHSRLLRALENVL